MKMNRRAAIEIVTMSRAKTNIGKFLNSNKQKVTVDVTKDIFGFSFKPFYHPYAEEVIEQLNTMGLSGIFNILSKKDEGSTFQQYTPNVNPEPDPLVQAPLPIESFTFDIKDFYAPSNWFTFYHALVLIVETLMDNNKNEEAIEWIETCIYNPKQVSPDGSNAYWKIPIFNSTVTQTTEDFFKSISNEELQAIVGELNEDPFNPFLVAYNRKQEFMMYVISLYIRAHIAVGDKNFRMIYNGGGMDYLNLALEYYKTAKIQLGERPQPIPSFLKKKPETYQSLKEKEESGILNPTANVFSHYENMFPFCSDVDLPETNTSTGSLLGGGYTFYFSIPPDKKILELHDSVDDRLSKLRSCRDIDGVVRKIDLFGTPINPAKLLSALAKGLSLGDILGGLFAPAPTYRFTFSLRKALEICGEVKSLGSSISSAIEKRDSERLAFIRAQHENAILEMQTSIKERQVLDAKLQKQALLKTRENTQFRLDHYKQLLGISDQAVPAYVDMPTDLTIESALPTDTVIGTVSEDVDVSLVDSDKGIKLIPREQKEITATKDAADKRGKAGGMELIAAGLNAIPSFSINATPFGVGGSTSFGGSNASAVFSAIAKHFQNDADQFTHDSNLSAKFGSYIRREQDWTFQLNQAAKDIIQMDKQLASADLKIQIAEEDFKIHKQQIENAKEVEDFLINKESNFVNYQYIIDKLKPVHKKLYDLAMYYARGAEHAYQFEHPEKLVDFISYDYENGIVGFSSAGDCLNSQLREMEKAYFQDSVRPNSIEKKISLNTLDPIAFLKLRKEGKATFNIPEWLILQDNPTVYNVKWASMRFSLPLLAGPNVNLHVKVRMTKNKVRVKPTGVSDAKDFPIRDDSDDRFVQVNSPFTEITISSSLNDNGLKLDSLGFSSETYQNQYLPFQNTGFICELEIDLNTHRESGTFFQLDWNTLTDLLIIGDISFSEDEGTYKTTACKYLDEIFKNLVGKPFGLMMDLKRDFSNDYYAFVSGNLDSAIFTLKKEHFPYQTQSKKIKIKSINIVSAEDLAGNKALVGSTNLNLSAGEKIQSMTIFQFKQESNNQNYSVELKESITIKLPISKDYKGDSFLLIDYAIEN
jgi:hypothetical protein